MKTCGMKTTPLEQKQTKRWDGFLRRDALDLDPIWSKMPLDLQLKLLEHLPLPCLLRCQLVCREWYKGVRNIDHVLACVDGQAEPVVEVCSSRHEQILQLTHPHFFNHYCSTSDGLLYYDDDEAEQTCLYNIFTRKSLPIPQDPVRDPINGLVEAVNVVGAGDRDREHIIARILRGGEKRMLVVFKTGRMTWETCHLQLPAGEEVSAAVGYSSHATIDNSILYFVTVNVRTRAMSVRWMDLRGDLDGTSTKLVSFPSLPSCYTMYAPEHCHSSHRFPDGPPFTGSIAVIGAKLFMACMWVSDPTKPWLCTVALFACDKQEKRWDFVSEMPMTEGFVAWRPGKYHFVELWSHGDKLTVANPKGQCACLYDTSTKYWSLFPVVGVCPLKLSMRF